MESNQKDIERLIELSQNEKRVKQKLVYDSVLCGNKGLNTNTYYNRLRVIREEILALPESEVQEIVPVSISSEISVNDTENTVSPTARDCNRDKAVIRKGDIEIELPERITQDMIVMFLRGLKEC